MTMKIIHPLQNLWEDIEDLLAPLGETWVLTVEVTKRMTTTGDLKNHVVYSLHDSNQALQLDAVPEYRMREYLKGLRAGLELSRDNI